MTARKKLSKKAKNRLLLEYIQMKIWPFNWPLKAVMMNRICSMIHSKMKVAGKSVMRALKLLKPKEDF